MFCTGSDDVDPGSVYIAMTEDVGELGNVLFNAIEGACKQMAEIVGKHLIRRYPRLLTQCFHLTPDIASAHRLAGFRDKDAPGSNSFGLDII